MTHGSVRPVWTRFYNEDIGCHDARIVGYRWEGRGERVGPTRSTVREARLDAPKRAVR
jgi:hypothetical protein